jgi:hypothetical protein
LGRVDPKLSHRVVTPANQGVVAAECAAVRASGVDFGCIRKSGNPNGARARGGGSVAELAGAVGAPTDSRSVGECGAGMLVSDSHLRGSVSGAGIAIHEGGDSTLLFGPIAQLSGIVRAPAIETTCGDGARR